jgi:excisionase family DNA binding protein
VDDYLTAQEAATSLGMNYHTLIARIKRKEIEATKRGWQWFIHKNEVERVRACNS